jgi:hypothetical protein
VCPLQCDVHEFHISLYGCGTAHDSSSGALNHCHDHVCSSQRLVVGSLPFPDKSTIQQTYRVGLQFAAHSHTFLFWRSHLSLHVRTRRINT